MTSPNERIIGTPIHVSLVQELKPRGTVVPVAALRPEDRPVFTPMGRTHGVINFNRFDPRQVGKQPTTYELQKPMKLDLPETPIEMIGKTIGDDIRALAKGMNITVYNFSAGAFGKEAHPVNKTHQLKARVYVEANSANFTYQELIVHRFLYERAKAMVSLPAIEKVAFEVTYEKAESK